MTTKGLAQINQTSITSVCLRLRILKVVECISPVVIAQCYVCHFFVKAAEPTYRLPLRIEQCRDQRQDEFLNRYTTRDESKELRPLMVVDQDRAAPQVQDPKRPVGDDCYL
jgi:hypothetical protein